MTNFVDGSEILGAFDLLWKQNSLKSYVNSEKHLFEHTNIKFIKHCRGVNMKSKYIYIIFCCEQQKMNQICLC